MFSCWYLVKTIGLAGILEDLEGNKGKITEGMGSFHSQPASQPTGFGDLT